MVDSATLGAALGRALSPDALTGDPAVCREHAVDGLAPAFVARPEKRVEPGPVSGRLLANLVEGAQERGLPESWVAHLRQQAAETPQPPPGRVGLKVEQKQKP